MTTTTAAWINGRNARLEVGPAPYTSPNDDQIVISNHAVSTRLDHPGRGQPDLRLAELAARAAAMTGQDGSRPARQLCGLNA